jgi:4,5-DOPA dioxygenase extradiol
MPVVYGAYLPNAPFLISPEAFGGTGADAARDIRSLQLRERFQPEVIVVASPHWVAPSGFLVNVSPHPRQIYDFSGFPAELNRVRYEPPGDPTLGRALVEEGRRRSIPVTGTTEWGLDHGAWAPLMRLLPGASLPTLPLSIGTAPASGHLAWGAAMRKALQREPRRVAFIGTGSITHAFGRFRSDATETWSEGAGIEREIVSLVERGRYEDLLRFDRAKWNKIEPEGGLGPLFMLLGALGPTFRARLVSTYQVLGAFGLSTLEFTPETAVVRSSVASPPGRVGPGPVH